MDDSLSNDSFEHFKQQFVCGEAIKSVLVEISYFVCIVWQVPTGMDHLCYEPVNTIRTTYRKVMSWKYSILTEL